MIMMLVCVLAAAIVGFAVHRGGTCGVMAVRDILHRRDARILVGFAAATGTATLVCLPLAWVLGKGDQLPGSASLGPELLLGAVLLGVGASVNGACLMGSLWRLGNGEVHLLALPLGILAGDALSHWLGWRVMLPPSRFAHPDANGLVLVAAGGLLLAAALHWLRRQGPQAANLALMMTAMGAAGSLLFVALPGWSWVDVVNNHARAVWDGVPPAMSPGLRVLLATLAGALGSGWVTGQLHLKWRGWPAVVRSLAGGLLMRLGIGLIPGGNDALLLRAAPAGAFSALLAFAVMNLAILAITWLQQVSRAATPIRH
ncbi:MAG: YeeE/YedE thiosulfate transporter family protein [Sphingomonadales bacterium]|jgi:hypothetical protein